MTDAALYTYYCGYMCVSPADVGISRPPCADHCWQQHGLPPASPAGVHPTNTDTALRHVTGVAAYGYHVSEVFACCCLQTTVGAPQWAHSTDHQLLCHRDIIGRQLLKLTAATNSLLFTSSNEAAERVQHAPVYYRICIIFGTHTG